VSPQEAGLRFVRLTAIMIDRINMETLQDTSATALRALRSLLGTYVCRLW
jgi:hypothetical protein